MIKNFNDTTTEPKAYKIKNNTQEMATVNTTTQVTMQTETLKISQELQKQLLDLFNEVKRGGKNLKNRAYQNTPDNPHSQGQTQKNIVGHMEPATTILIIVDAGLLVIKLIL